MPTTSLITLTDTILTSTSATVSLSNISQSYSHLRLVITATATAQVNLKLNINNKTTGDYYYVSVTGDNSGTTLTHQQGTTFAYLNINEATVDNTYIGSYILDFFNYKDTNNYKNIQGRTHHILSGSNATYSVERAIYRVLDTNPISSIQLSLSSTAQYSIGSRFTLFGLD